jgi:CRP-like cAMP-binding protein
VPFFDVPGSVQTDERVFLAGASEADWQTFVRCTGAESFRADQILIKRGDPGDSFYIVAEGSVEVKAPSPFGERTITRIPAGSVFGEIAFLDGGVRTATIRAATDGTMLRCSRSSFAALQAREPHLAGRIALELARLCAMRLRSTLERAAR